MIKAAVVDSNKTPAIPDSRLAGTAVDDGANDEYQPGADMDGSAEEDNQEQLNVVAPPKMKRHTKPKTSLQEQVDTMIDHSEEETEVRKGKRKAHLNTADDQL